MAKGEATALATAAHTATTMAMVGGEGEKVDTVMAKAAIAAEWVAMAEGSTTTTSTAMMVREVKAREMARERKRKSGQSQHVRL